MITLPNDISGFERLVSDLLSELERVKAELSLVKSELSLVSSENTRLRLENADLKSQLGLNSSNSHKPPSGDGLTKPPTLPRGKGGKVGGQKGHKGNTLKMVREVDDVQRHYPTTCSHCGQALSSQACQLSERRQVFDLPQPKLLVTEDQVFVCHCDRCSRATFGDFPKGVNAPVQYGSGAKAFVVLLHQDFLLPFAKVSDLFSTLFGQPLNVSTLQSSNKVAYEALETTEAAIKTAIIHSPVAHFDETGLHINGTLNWWHVAATEQHTYYFAHAKRGTPALEDSLSVLRDFKGVAVHDCWSSYFKFEQCQHALCNAHLLRELQAALERGYSWAKDLQERFKELLHLKQTDKLTPEILKKHRKKLKQRLKTIQKSLDEAQDSNSKGIQKTKALIRRLRQHLDKFLAFAHKPDVPFTNNQAERDIRMVKLKAKISGGFRTDEGAHIFARIKGVMATARKQGKNIFNILKAAFDNEIGQKQNLLTLT